MRPANITAYIGLQGAVVHSAATAKHNGVNPFFKCNWVLLRTLQKHLAQGHKRHDQNWNPHSDDLTWPPELEPSLR